MRAKDRATAIYLRHRTPVWQYLRRLTASRDQADDLCQEVLLRVVRGLDRYEEWGRERAWVFQIARRVVADHWRRCDPVAAPDTDVPDAGGAREPVQLLRVSLNEALSQLSPESRQILLLREVAGLTRVEIAAATGLSEAAVANRLSRTRKWLQQRVIWERRSLQRDGKRE